MSKQPQEIEMKLLNKDEPSENKQSSPPKPTRTSIPFPESLFAKPMPSP